uniref:DUF223 domain-containing protein n=1 Tax=Strongyloides papillosus TaxID=174720 RepID=A0A0N5CIR4_STREA
MATLVQIYFTNSKSRELFIQKEVKVSPVKLVVIHLRKAVIKATKSINYFSCFKEIATLVQIYFTNSKSRELFIPKEVKVSLVKVYFKLKDDQPSLYEEGLIVAKLDIGTNLIETEAVRYYVGIDFCHFEFTSTLRMKRSISTIMEVEGDVEEEREDDIQERKQSEVVCQ